MVVDTDKPGKPEPTAGTGTGAAAASPEQPVAKPAARQKAATVAAPAATKPVRKTTPIAAKAATAAPKKPVSRPAVRKSPLVNKAVHEPEPFVTKSNTAGKPAKVKKARLVRDSFTMPDDEYALITALKKRCLLAGVSAKKSEILRAAVANLAKLGDSSVVAAVRRLEVIKTGRPAKGTK